MMYRSGWAVKEGQENILAITISTDHFDEILNKAVVSSFSKEFYNTEEAWKNDLALNDVRLQWDPDHDPRGNKLERRAIQLGLKEETLEKYGKEFVLKIENITPFVREQHEHVKNGRIDMLQVPYESIYIPKSKDLASKIGLSL
jgi:phage head maturation protease